MSDASGHNIDLHVRVITHIENALAQVKALSQAAVTNTSGSFHDRSKAISEEIALTRTLRDEEVRLERARAGYGPKEVGLTPKKGEPGYGSRRAGNAELRSLVESRTAGLDDALKAEVLRQVGNPSKQRSFAAGLGYLPPPPQPGSRADVKGYMQEAGGDARAHAARLQGAQGTDETAERFRQSLLALDAETKRFYTVMERMRAESEAYTESATQAAVAHRQLTAIVQTAAESEESYIASTLALAQSRRRLNQETILSMVGVSTKGMTPQQVQDKAAEAQRRLGLVDTTRQVKQAAGSTGEIQERAALKTAYSELNAKVRQEAAKTNRGDDPGATEFREGLISAETEMQRLALSLDQTRLASTQYTEAASAAAVAHRELAAIIQAGAAGEEASVQANALLTQARRRLSQETVLAMAGVSTKGLSPQQIKDEAATASRRLGIVDRTRQNNQAATSTGEVEERAALKTSLAALNAAVREETLQTEGYVDAKIRARIALEEENAVVREALREGALSGQFGGTGYQRVQAYASPSGALPSEKQTFGQSLLTKGLSSFQYTLSGFASGALIFGILDAVKEATKLETVLAGLKGQLGAIGQGNSFQAVRSGIKEISSQTGVAASEVTRFVSRLAGLFDDPQRALKETTAAMNLAVVSGTDINVLLEELVPVARAFGLSIEQIGDSAVSLHDKFGISESDALQFFGATAAAAKEAGFSFQQLGPIGAAAANSVGVSANVAGEQFTKVIETIRNNADKVYSVYARRPDTKGIGDSIIESLGKGDGGGAFKQILASYNQLDTAQKQNLVRVSGSRKEWALLNGLFSHSDDLLNDIISSEAGVDDSSGSLNRRFAEVSQTINLTSQRVQDLIRNLVEGIVSSGVGAAFNLMLRGFEAILTAGAQVLDLFGRLNDKLKFGPFDGGLLALLASIATGVFVVSRLYRGYTAVKEGHQRITALLEAQEAKLKAERLAAAAAAEAEAAAEAQNTAAKTGNVSITTASTGVTAALGTTQATTAAQITANSVAVGANTTVKEANIVVTTSMAGQATVSGATSGVSSFLGSATGNAAGNVTGPAAGGAAAGGFAGLLSRFWGSITGLFSGGLAGLKGGLGAVGGASAESAFAVGPIAAGVVSGIVSTNWAKSQARDGGVALKLPVIGDVLPGGLELHKQSDLLKRQMAKLNDDDLAKLADERNDVFDNIEEALFNEDLPHTAAWKERETRTGAAGRKSLSALQRTGRLAEFTSGIKRENAQGLTNFLNQADETKDLAKKVGLTDEDGKVSVTPEKLEAAIPKILEAASNGEAGANQLVAGIDDILQHQQSLGDVKKAVDAALRAGGEAGRATEQAVSAAGGMDAFLSKQYDPKGALATGQINTAEYLAQLDQDISVMRSQLNVATDPAQAYANLNAKIKEGQDVRDNLLLAQLDELNKQADFESSTPKADQLANMLRVLPTLSVPQQAAQLPRLQDAARAKLDESLNKAVEPEERYRLATEGVAVDPAVQALDLTAKLGISDKGNEAVLELSDHGDPADRQQLSKEIADEAIRTGKTIKQVLLERLKRRKDILKLFAKDTSGVDAIISAVEGMPDISTDATLTKDTPQEHRKEVEGKLKSTQAELALAKSVGGIGKRRQASVALADAQARLTAAQESNQIGGEGAATKADIDNAQAGVNEALRTTADIVRETADAMDQWAVINAYGNPVKQANERLAASRRSAARLLEKLGGDTNDPEYIKSQEDIRSQEIAALQSENENALALMDWAEINAGQDERGALNARIDKAKVALQQATAAAGGDTTATPVIKAAQELRKLEQETIKMDDRESTSRYSVLLAYAERDPLQVALLQQAQAQEALDKAEGVTAKNEALANKIKADHAVEDALSGIMESRANLAIAMAEAAGDTVGAAELQAKEAKRKLDEAVAQGRGEIDVNRLRGEYATASENYLKSGRSREEQITDFQLQMGQITTQTAVESLRLILSRTREGTDEYMQLALKIKSLEDQAGQDLQFNLPSTLGLPTLYESRRVSQSTTAGMGYQDNRNIVLSVNVNGAQDPMAVTNQIMSAFSSAVGTSNTYAPLNSGVNY